MLPTEVVDLDKKIYKFWKNYSLNNIKPNTGEEFPEGWNVVNYFKNEFNPFDPYGKIIEIGCGYGRLCTAFNFEDYLGLDISPEAIRIARKVHPNYKFQVIKKDDIDNNYPYSDTKLLYTVLLHQTDEDIQYIIKRLCDSSRTIIVAEITGRDWRREGNPPVFNRNVEEYQSLFADYGKNSCRIINKPYKRYEKWDKSNTNLTIMVFDE